MAAKEHKERKKKKFRTEGGRGLKSLGTREKSLCSLRSFVANKIA
jgi:hypothetical protein